MSAESRTPSVPKLTPLQRQAWDEVWALEHMSYTGGQPDLDKYDIQTIADLIARLANALRELNGL